MHPSAAHRGRARSPRKTAGRVLDDTLSPCSPGLGEAKAVLATNAVNYHVNKLRALECARKRGQQVKYAIAKDTISSRALQEKPGLGKDKLTWLQRHDQDCGGRRPA